MLLNVQLLILLILYETKGTWTYLCMTTFLMIHQLMPTSSSWRSDFDLTMTIADADMHIQWYTQVNRVLYPLTALNRHVVIAADDDDDQRGNC